MNFDNSETKKNLELAFGGESKARNKYTYFASIAKKEGYEEIASIFLEFASNEKEKRTGKRAGRSNQSP